MSYAKIVLECPWRAEFKPTHKTDKDKMAHWLFDGSKNPTGQTTIEDQQFMKNFAANEFMQK